MVLPRGAARQVPVTNQSCKTLADFKCSALTLVRVFKMLIESDLNRNQSRRAINCFVGAEPCRETVRLTPEMLLLGE